MSSIYLVRRGDGWLRHRVGVSARFVENMDSATTWASRVAAEFYATRTGGELVEFRAVAGDTAAGALAAAEATIARLRAELEQLRNRPSTHELAKRYLESTNG